MNETASCTLIVASAEQPHRNERRRAMSKTKYMATIGQLNRQTRRRTYFDRRVFEDDQGNRYVRINGCFFSFDDLETLGDTVDVWL